MKGMIVVAVTALSLGTGVAFAQGTPPGYVPPNYGAREARAMLERVVAAVNANEPGALAKFSKGEDGFKDRDLYVFCIGRDHKVDAHPNPAMIGVDMETLKDKNGKMVGQEMSRVAEEGKFNAVTYVWPRLGTDEPVPKVSFVTKIKAQICGVGYYK